MHYALLCGYNNYRNRTYRKSSNLAAYVDASDTSYVSTDKDTNFSIEDGIVMSHVFNIKNYTGGEPNYLLLLDKDTNEIESRWFVIDWNKIRGGQYAASLRKDLLADNYEAITKAPCFIEKGYVGPEDSAIFNKEDMTFNQIKTRETILRDDSRTSWIVGYIAQDHTALTNKSFTIKPEVDLTVSGNFSDWEYASWCDGAEHKNIDLNSPNRFEFAIENVFVLTKSYGVVFRYGKDYHYAVDTSGQDMNDRWWCDTQNQGWALKNSDWWSDISLNTTIEKLELDNPSWCPTSVYNNLYSLIGKKIQFNDGVYELSLNYNIEQQARDWSSRESNLYTYLYNNINNQLNTKFGSNIAGVVNYPVSYRIYLNKFRIVANKIENIQGTYTYNIPQTVRKLDDAPYKMFCIPYYKDVVTTNTEYGFSLNGTTRTDCNADLMLAWAMDIATQFGDNLYDLQILPYCPLSNWRGRSGVTNAAVWSMDKTEHVDYEYLTETVEETTYSRGVISFCDVSTKEQFLQYPIEIVDYKIENECDMYRLCSPNYASVFEFNAAKNNGVEGYNVRYTYKPYQPFINVAPKFGRLYGKDFKDNRGLILAGDFSLPIVREAWIDYQLRNKNYQLAFDRQIENMEVQYKQQKTQSIWGTVAGTLQGGVSGAAAGSMAGGVPGAIIGGVAGTAFSVAGGITDINMQDEMYRESVDFTKDNFGFQLGNIKALPNTLNKVSSIVANSKLFPFLEYYTCTDEEKQALDDKLKYNGMTIGRIGKIEDFLHPDAQTYVKGQLIRLEGNYDAHTANEIANEFMKGWYI